MKIKNFITLLLLSSGVISAFGQLSFTLENVGELHNAVLDAYLGQYSRITPANYQTQTPVADNFSCSYLFSLYGQNYFCADATANSSNHIAYVGETVSNTKQVLQNAFETKVNHLQQANILADQLSQSYLNSYKAAIFESGSNSAMRNSFVSLAGSVENAQLPLASRELLISLLDLSISSFDYWITGGGNLGEDDPQGFIIGDCVGYLAGWGSAVLSEINSNGGLSEENWGHRVSQGLLWGAAGSVVGP